jgi:uncharacterized protein
MKYQVADEIEILRRDGKSIVFNAKSVNPVFLPDEGTQLLEIIENLKKLGEISFDSLPEECTNEIFDFLATHSLIVPVLDNEMLQQQKCCKCSSVTGKSNSRSVYLLLTQSCNQACIYCLNGKETYQKAKQLMMSEEIAYKSLDTTMDSLTDDGRMEVVLFGGEPLMNWGLAKKILHYCEEELLPKNPNKSAHYHLTTNLTLFPPDLIEYTKKFNITYLVDIDGPEEIHDYTRPFINGKGSFKTTANNIKKLKEAGIDVALRATVTSHNVERMVEVAKTHKELGANSSAFVPLNPVDSDINLLEMNLCPDTEKLAQGLKDIFHSGIWPTENLYPFNEYTERLQPGFKNLWGCGAPFGNTPVITYDGQIYSCIYLVGNSTYKVGHVNNDDFPRQDVLNMMMETVNIDNRESCKQCSFRYLCGGGCPVGVFSVASNPEATDELKEYVQQIACTVSETVLEELFWNIAKEL